MTSHKQPYAKVTRYSMSPDAKQWFKDCRRVEKEWKHNFPEGNEAGIMLLVQELKRLISKLEEVQDES